MKEELRKKILESFNQQINSWGGLWGHPIADLYEYMYDKKLIPVSGDSEYMYPSIVLYINRILYEKLNNGGYNYFSNQEDFYDTMSKMMVYYIRHITNKPCHEVISEVLKTHTKEDITIPNLENFAHIVMHEDISPDVVSKTVSALALHILENEDKWEQYKHDPIY